MSVFPDRRQLRLIRAAVGEGDDALRAWAAWRQDGDLDRVDAGSYRLLPQLYRNLSALGAAEPWLGRLRGIYRYHWYLNQMLRHGAADAVRALEAEGVPTLVLKGAALASLHYRDVAARPMDDVDVLVPRDRAHDAMRALRGAGLVPTTSQVPEERMCVNHAEPFADARGHTVDLHWYSLWQPSREADFWSRSVPLELAGAATRALDPADQLVHVCLHGARWSGSPAIRWVADAAMVIRSSNGSLDWERVVESARARRLTLTLAAALAHLRTAAGAAVPEDTLAALRAARVSPLERRLFAVGQQPPTRGGRALQLYDRYRRLRAVGDPEAGSGLLRFLARARGLDGRWQLAVAVVWRDFGRSAGSEPRATVSPSRASARRDP